MSMISNIAMGNRQAHSLSKLFGNAYAVCLRMLLIAVLILYLNFLKIHRF